MNTCTECGSEDDYNFSLNIGLCNACIGKKIERLEEENRWIPVGERLPEEGVFCHIFIPAFNKCCPQRGWYKPKKRHWSTTTRGRETTRQVTHWKPITLPEGD